MYITNLINDVLQRMVDGLVLKSRLYTYPQQMNVKAGKCQMPMGALMTPYEWKMEIDGITAKEKGKFRVYFLTAQKNLDFDAQDNEHLIDDMIAIATQFIADLRNERSVRIVSSELDGASVYDATDRNLTGCRVTLEIEQNQGRCIEPDSYCGRWEGER